MAREKIVILALPGIGDALLSTPMIELLRRAKPNAEIHAFVMFSAVREMFERDPNIDVVHHHDFLNLPKGQGLRFLCDLRKEKFDLSINIYPQNRREYNLIALLIGAKERIAVKYRRRDPQNLSWINTKTILEDDTLHCVEQNVRLLSLIGVKHELSDVSLPALRLTIGEKHEQFGDDWYKKNLRGDEKLLIGFHAGTALFKNHIRRRWEPEKFAALAERLTNELGTRVLLFGGPDDVDANRVILDKAKDYVTMVETKSILDSIAVMGKVDLFVSNDSSLMHIAGALKLPTVAIFGPTNETYVHPWKTRYTIVHTGIDCRPCFVYSPKPLTCYRTNPDEHYLCIRGIEVGYVFGAVKDMLHNKVTLPVL
jgi:heptosyltransferase II